MPTELERLLNTANDSGTGEGESFKTCALCLELLFRVHSQRMLISIATNTLVCCLSM
jgi:hypothetical protein